MDSKGARKLFEFLNYVVAFGGLIGIVGLYSYFSMTIGGVVCGVCALIGCSIGEPKQAGTEGFWLGLLFGPIGLVLALAMDNRAQCPECGGRINGTKEK